MQTPTSHSNLFVPTMFKATTQCVRGLAFVFLFSLATLGSAAQLGHDGRGQVLIFPFFTAENDWDTYLTINTAASGGQVVRLRVMSPRDGTPLHTFNIYSSPGENFRAAVTKVQGVPTLRIAEGSCIVSDTGEFGGADSEFPLSESIGMLEAYAVTRYFDDFFARITFGEPLGEFTCSDVAARFQGSGVWTQDLNDRMVIPFPLIYSNEISGYYDLVNVQRGLSAGYPAVAIRDFAETIVHSAPSSSTPDMTSADPVAVLADGSVFEPASGEGIDAIAQLFTPLRWRGSTEAGEAPFINDVITVKGIAASTDWVVTYPLRGYAPERPMNAVVNGEPALCEISGNRSQSETFVDSFDGNETRWRVWGEGDHEVLDDGPALDPSPPVRYQPVWCNAVNITSFGDSNPVFLNEDSEYQYRIAEIRDISVISFINTSRRVGYAMMNGWIKEEESFVPILGFRATTFVNGTLEGGSLLANYMTLRPHTVR